MWSADEEPLQGQLEQVFRGDAEEKWQHQESNKQLKFTQKKLQRLIEHLDDKS